MNLKELFPIIDQFKHIQGIESKLRQRRRNGLLASVIAILAGIFEVIRELALNNELFLGYLSRVVQQTLLIGRYLWAIVTLQWQALPAAQIGYEVVGFYFILLGVIIYLLSRHTAFLFRMTEAPFQYTFWIDRFTRAEDRAENKEAINEDDQIHHLLHYDLMDMLNQRIGRFSLLDEQYFNADAPDNTPPSHIHIDGHYTLRSRDEDGGSVTVIQVMPRVRIGPPGNPSILTQPVEVELANAPDSASVPMVLGVPADNGRHAANGAPPAGPKTDQSVSLSQLSQEIYNQILEQVYSKVASEVYKQIKFDIKQKIHLFPTKYLRAMALYYEAEDFSRSNTIDAYDYAIELYQEALRYYDISIRTPLSDWLLLWRWTRLGVGYESMRASTKIGYAKCLIYRREISSLTGRTQNALYEIPAEMNQVVSRLILLYNKFDHQHRRYRPVLANGEADQEKQQIRYRLRLTLSTLTFKKDTWQYKYLKRKPDILRFEKLTKQLFDAYVVLALAYAYLGATKKAKAYLETSRAAYPDKCDNNALFLLTQAEVKLDIASKIPFLIQSTEMAPNFEIAQYLLAKYRLQLFLARGEIDRERARPVIKEFNKVFKINPGNIATFAHLGYLYWLIDDLTLAQKQFEQGIKTKAIVQQTFIGELNYGLARIAAKHGQFNSCFDLYSEALASEPGLGVFSIESIGGKSRATSFYDFITPAVLARYKSFRQNFEAQIQAALGRFSTDDIIDLPGLKSALADEQRAGSSCIRQKIGYPPDNRAAQLVAASASDLAASLNNLLIDDKLEQDVTRQNKALARQFEGLKQDIGLQPGDTTRLARWNRLILEQLYPQLVRPSGIDQYFELFLCQRSLFENSQIPLSIDTLNQAYCYVLTDYGNACLTYYHRFGDIEQLDEAMEAFKKAIALNPDNGIAYYNMANAVMWRYRASYQGFEETKVYLQKADEHMATPWPKVIIDAVRYQMWDLLYKIEQEEESIRVDESQLATLKEEIEGLNKTIREQSIVRQAAGSQAANQQPFGNLENELAAKISEQQQLIDGLPAKRNSLNNARREFDHTFNSAIGRTIELSKLAAVIKGFGIDSTGSSVDDFINIEIGPDRLDEKDLEALRSWADLLSINQSSRPALEASQKLCKFIARYTPESFDVDNIMIGAFQRMDELELGRILEQYPLDRVLDQDQLVAVFGTARAEELVKRPPGAILKEDKYWLNQVKDQLRAPRFKMSDLKQPSRLLARLINTRDKLSIDSEIDHLKRLQAEWFGRRLSQDELALELNRLLNRLIKGHIYRERTASLAPLSPGLRGLISLELAGRLKGEDLVRFNRRLLEEIHSEEIAPSQLELYRDRICETIRDIWLAGDPIHYLAIDEWAKSYLIFPQLEYYLKEAIRHTRLNVDQFHAALAELYEKAGYGGYARQNFEQAINSYPHQGIYHLKLAQLLQRDDQFEASKSTIETARENGIITQADYDQELKEIFRSEANLLAAREEWRDAALKYTEALAIFPENSEFKRSLEDAEKEHKKQKIARHYGQKWTDQLLVVTPVAVEVAYDLIPLVEGEEGGLRADVQELVTQMRDRILARYGVRVPGVRFRGNETDMPGGSYLVMINEIPLVMGTSPPDKRLFTGPVEALQAAGITADQVTSDLQTGETAYWLRQAEIDQLTIGQVKPWGALEYLMRHLELILRANLVEFLGHQEVANMIEMQYSEKSNDYDASPQRLSRLTTVLRGLVSERVPVTAFRPILDFVEQRHDEQNLSDLINDVRLLPEVRKDLPGNRNITRCFKLGPDVEASFQEAVFEEDERYVLAMVPETVQEILAVIRARMDNKKDEAIIVSQKRLRPLANQLLKLEFSNTAIIALDELMDPYGDIMNDAAEITFE